MAITGRNSKQRKKTDDHDILHMNLLFRQDYLRMKRTIDEKMAALITLLDTCRRSPEREHNQSLMAWEDVFLLSPSSQV